MPTNIAISVRRPAPFVRDAAKRMSMDPNLPIVCLWSVLGSLLTLLALAHGFGTDAAQSLAMIG